MDEQIPGVKDEDVEIVTKSAPLIVNIISFTAKYAGDNYQNRSADDDGKLASMIMLSVIRMLGDEMSPKIPLVLAHALQLEEDEWRTKLAERRQ